MTSEFVSVFSEYPLILTVKTLIVVNFQKVKNVVILDFLFLIKVLNTQIHNDGDGRHCKSSRPTKQYEDVGRL